MGGTKYLFIILRARAELRTRTGVLLFRENESSGRTTLGATREAPHPFNQTKDYTGKRGGLYKWRKFCERFWKYRSYPIPLWISMPTPNDRAGDVPRRFLKERSKVSVASLLVPLWYSLGITATTTEEGSIMLLSTSRTPHKDIRERDETQFHCSFGWWCWLPEEQENLYLCCLVLSSTQTGFLPGLWLQMTELLAFFLSFTVMKGFALPLTCE